jgi:hypothetical protein
MVILLVWNASGLYLRGPFYIYARLRYGTTFLMDSTMKDFSNWYPLKFINVPKNASFEYNSSICGLGTQKL